MKICINIAANKISAITMKIDNIKFTFYFKMYNFGEIYDLRKKQI